MKTFRCSKKFLRLTYENFFGLEKLLRFAIEIVVRSPDFGFFSVCSFDLRKVKIFYFKIIKVDLVWLL